MNQLPHNTALLVIDMQRGFDDPAWGPRNNPDCEANVASLLAAWRVADAPVIHVFHDSPSPAGRMRPGTMGNLPKEETHPWPAEPVYRKTVNSAFIGTELEADLRLMGIDSLAIVGLTTNHCVSTTARMAGNLGFRTFVVADATATFDRATRDGQMRRAEDVHQAALSDLQDEFATIVDTKWLLAEMTSTTSQFYKRLSALALACVLTLGTLSFTTGARAAEPARIPTLEIDRTVKPADDFYRYANNPWLQATVLPAGVAKLDTTSLLRAENAQRVQGLLDDAVAGVGGASPAITQKVACYYATYLDTAAIEAKGMAPLRADLDDIAAIADRKALAAYLGKNVRLDDGGNLQTESLWGIWIHQGFHDADRYAVHVMQGGLGLPTRELYLDADKQQRRDLYRAHVANLLRLAGFDRAEERAARVLALETAIAQTHASRTDTDDVHKTDNVWHVADFVAQAPHFDWPTYFEAAGLTEAPSFVVWQPGAVIGSAKLAATESLEAWKDYLAVRLLVHYADVLPAAIGDERRAFAARVNGQAAPAAPDRKALAVTATNAVLGDAIGQLYVARYVPPNAKQAATEMADNLRAAFRVRLQASKWMTPATKQKAIAKLDALKLGVVHPDRWVDYTDLKLMCGDAFGNLQHAERFVMQRELAKLTQPHDPAEWNATLHPQNVGAILNISPNSMQFAAGLLQPPYFDPNGDAASNYGSAGAGMAHEISHSFDEVGNLYDAQGRLGLWWTKEDADRFAAMNAPLAAQLDKCEAAPGVFTHGKQVLGESVADLIGLEVAHDAYLRSLHGKKDAVIGGLTGEQRFFIAFAQRWRTVYSEAGLKRQVEADTHAPANCRAGLVRSVEGWRRAFSEDGGAHKTMR